MMIFLKNVMIGLCVTNQSTCLRNVQECRRTLKRKRYHVIALASSIMKCLYDLGIENKARQCRTL